MVWLPRHWDRSHKAREAMVGSVAHSGRVIFTAGAAMVAVLLTFRPVRAAATRGDGDHPRHPSHGLRSRAQRAPAA